jgi:hypothetical protein
MEIEQIYRILNKNPLQIPTQPNFSLLEFVETCRIAEPEFSDTNRKQLIHLLCYVLSYRMDITKDPENVETLLLKLISNRKQEIVRHWWITRNPRLESIIVKSGCLKSTEWANSQDTTPNYFMVLAFKHAEYDEITNFLNISSFENNLYALSHCMFDENPAIRQATVDYCRSLSAEKRLILCQKMDNLSGTYKSIEAMEWLASEKYYSERDYPRVVISLINNKFATCNAETEKVIEILVDFIRHNQYPHPLIAERVEAALRGLQTPVGRDYLCRSLIKLYINGGSHKGLESLVRESGYEPSNHPDKALFLFFTRQFEKYETFDFDRRILRSVHNSADNKTRKFITNIIRTSGRIEYLDIIATHPTTEGQTVYDQQETTIEILQVKGQWGQLWQKVFEFNFWGSVRVLDIVAKSGWRPVSRPEQTLMDELCRIIELGLPKSRPEIEPVELFEQALCLFSTSPVDNLRALTPTELTPETRHALLYIEKVLSHQFQHDIELEFAPNIQPDDADIELDNL